MTESILLTVSIYGLAIVISFAVAALIKGIVIALPLMNRRAASVERPSVLNAADAPPAHVAAITAAVAAMAGPRHIIHIEDRGQATSWSAEGRRIHQTSHAVEHSPKR